MVTYVKAKQLHEGIEQAMTILNEGKVVQGANQDQKDQLKEIHLVMDIESVQDVKISKAMPSDLYTLVDYVLELVEGTRDFEAEIFDYTYHQLFSENLQFVIDRLMADKDTRQATLHVSNQRAARLPHPPCLQLIHYTIIDNKLNTNVVFRSNDGVKAITMNAFAIVELSRTIAKAIGVELGSYTHDAISFHAYSKDWDALDSYCKMFKERDCTFSYEEYLEVYDEVADECREKCLKQKAEAESKHKGLCEF